MYTHASPKKSFFFFDYYRKIKEAVRAQESRDKLATGLMFCLALLFHAYH